MGERNKDLDNVYGLRKLTKDRLMIRDSPISFSENNIHVGNLNFPKSKGLLELLFKKVPEESFVSTDDQRNYGKIINAPNAYKKHFKPDGEVRYSKAFKYKNFINKFIPTSPLKSTNRRSKNRDSSGQGVISQHMIDRERNQLDYVYWDDPN